jgi:DNA (cytosine-5)-methyltransferase 1
VNALDLFAGPGGWDVGAQALGIDPLGIEYDDAAVATRKAYGLRTIHADVTTLDPLEVARSHSEEAAADGIDLLIASPPCQAWSMAGSRQGEHDREEVYALARRWGADAGTDWADDRSPLAAEPMRWVDALEPGLVAFEQVPPVIDLWRLCASLMAERGYAVWTGILSAERYGVPQTRKRAILLASKLGGVHPPLPTHLPYVAGEPKPEPMMTLEGELLPWVTMREALGWGVDAPTPTIAAGKTGDGRVFGSDDRADATFARRVFIPSGGERPNATSRSLDNPASTLFIGHDVPKWLDDPTSTAAEKGVRVSIDEAAVIQSFPAGYPWQGSNTSKYRQIGNAYPPLMAKATLEALIS